MEALGIVDGIDEDGDGALCSFDIGTQERGADFGDQFLAGVGVIGEGLAEAAVATMGR